MSIVRDLMKASGHYAPLNLSKEELEELEDEVLDVVEDESDEIDDELEEVEQVVVKLGFEVAGAVLLALQSAVEPVQRVLQGVFFFGLLDCVPKRLVQREGLQVFQ